MRSPLVLLVLAPLAAHATDFGVAGSASTSSTKNLTVSAAGQSLSVDLYYPTNAPGPGPAAVVAHGFSGSKSDLAAWGTHLASWGMVVAVPTFPSSGSAAASGNANSLNALLDWLGTEGARSGSPVFGKVDATRRAVLGYSAGGAAALIAAGREPKDGVVVGLDPVDDNGQQPGAAAAAVATAAGMGVVLSTEPASCNNTGSDQAAVYAAFPGQKLALKVVNANHCDPPDPASGLCGLACGAPDATRAMHFKRYATAAIRWALFCDSAARGWIDGSEVAAELTAGTVAALASANLGCATPAADGGVADAGAPDAGPIDAGTPDAGGGTDAGAGDASAADAAAGDAGAADGGVIDAGRDGGFDAGTDGGTAPADAGSPDAGGDAGAAADGSHAADGGGASAAPGGCGCGAGALLPSAALLPLALRRRRERR